MPSVQGIKNGTRIIRITMFACWGRRLKPQWIQDCSNTHGVIAIYSAVIAGLDPAIPLRGHRALLIGITGLRRFAAAR